MRNLAYCGSKDFEEVLRSIKNSNMSAESKEIVTNIILASVSVSFYPEDSDYRKDLEEYLGKIGCYMK